MRADNDHALGNSVESCEDAELKIPENGKNDNNVCELFYDTRSGNDWDKENDGNMLESHSCGDSIKAENKSRDTSHDFAANGVSPEKVDPVFYMDKKITVCDLAEIVVCYKENAYHVVKDICVDEGVPVQEKFLFGEKDSVKCSSNSNQCGSEDLVKAGKTNVNPFETKSSEDSNSKVDDSEFCNDRKSNRGFEESSREDFADAEGSSNCNQEHLIVMEEVKDSPNSSEMSLKSEENTNEELTISSENVLKESLTLGDILSREDEHKPLNNNNNNIDRPEEQSPHHLQEKEKRSLETKALETELQKTEEPKKAEEKLSSVLTTTSQDSNKTCNEHKIFSSDFGEMSFSAAEPVSVSGHITYSGPIAFSGSLSVRSDASTTSGRSFAFPILNGTVVL